MGHQKVEVGRKSCRCKCCYEKTFTGKERVRDLSSVKIEEEKGMKTRGIAFSSVIGFKCCNQSLSTVLSHAVAEG